MTSLQTPTTPDNGSYNRARSSSNAENMPPMSVIHLNQDNDKSPDTTKAAVRETIDKPVRRRGSRTRSLSCNTLPFTSLSHDLSSDLELRGSSSSDEGTLVTAEETVMDEGDTTGDEQSLTSSTSSPPSSPDKDKHKTLIDAPVFPSNRHRRQSSAVPRLQSIRERPPLPPKRGGTMARFSTTPSTQTLQRAQSMGAWEDAPRKSVMPLDQRPPRPSHRRIASAPASILTDKASIPSLEVQLKEAQELHGKRHYRVAALWNLLGNTHFRNKDWGAALKAYKEAILCEPGDHLADSYSNMGTVFWTTGQLDKAVPFLQKALSVHQSRIQSSKKDPKQSLPVATVQYQLGLALTLQHEYEEAVKALMHSQAIRVAVLGKNHPDVARTLDALGRLHLMQGDTKAALKAHQEALHIKTILPDANGTKARSVLISLQSIAAVHRVQGDVDAAILAFGDLVRAQQEESDRAGMAESFTILGELFGKRGMDDKARSCLQEAERMLELSGLPKDHPLRLAIEARLA